MQFTEYVHCCVVIFVPFVLVACVIFVRSMLKIVSNSVVSGSVCGKLDKNGVVSVLTVVLITFGLPYGLVVLKIFVEIIVDESELAIVIVEVSVDDAFIVDVTFGIIEDVTAVVLVVPFDFFLQIT